MNKLEQAAQNIINYSESREASLQGWPDWEEKFDALREALAEQERYNHETGSVLIPNPLAKQAEQEPVAKVLEGGYEVFVFDRLPEETPLYAAPVRTKDLTDDEIDRIVAESTGLLYIDFARAVIAKFKEKNK